MRGSREVVASNMGPGSAVLEHEEATQTPVSWLPEIKVVALATDKVRLITL